MRGARGNEEQNAILASCVYDYSLMMKGLLLSADNRVDRLLTEHPDSIVRVRYAQMKNLAARLDNMTMRGSDPSHVATMREALKTAQRDIIMLYAAWASKPILPADIRSAGARCRAG